MSGVYMEARQEETNERIAVVMTSDAYWCCVAIFLHEI